MRKDGADDNINETHNRDITCRDISFFLYHSLIVHLFYFVHYSLLSSTRMRPVSTDI